MRKMVDDWKTLYRQGALIQDGRPTPVARRLADWPTGRLASGHAGHFIPATPAHCRLCGKSLKYWFTFS
jgi:hypothetical protein